MPLTILIGAQWGDEGKGRVVDWVASSADVIARFSGGDNAGHTVFVDDKVFKLHLIPSGILHEKVVNVLGNGMVINLPNLVTEINHLKELGIDVSPDRLKISSRAHIITPAHVALDAAKEKARGGQAIGTTLRGIGPAYLDKVGRNGIRVGAIQDIERFAEELERSINAANETLEQMGSTAIDAHASAQQYVDAAYQLRDYVTDTTRYLNQQLDAEADVVCEGAQGTLLDVDHGSYPFVTSSSPTAGGALAGIGVGPAYVERVIGVAKAFSTRVGSGPMPTELTDSIGDLLRGTGANFWDEFGTTTGRPRRCGWLDTVLLRYASDVNGFTEMVITKLDILSGFEEIKLAVEYEIDGKRVDYPPSTIEELERATPIYETLPGWQEDVTEAREVGDLPANARRYLERISAICDVPVTMISVGPERQQFIHR